jgi:hypothetical protein
MSQCKAVYPEVGQCYRSAGHPGPHALPRPLTEGETYIAWLQTEEGPEPRGTLSDDAIRMMRETVALQRENRFVFAYAAANPPKFSDQIYYVRNEGAKLWLALHSRAVLPGEIDEDPPEVT